VYRPVFPCFRYALIIWYFSYGRLHVNSDNVRTKLSGNAVQVLRNKWYDDQRVSFLYKVSQKNDFCHENTILWKLFCSSPVIFTVLAMCSENLKLSKHIKDF